MCGVIALRAWQPAADLALRARRGLAALASRGPDGEGLDWVETAPPLLLGHRRLSVLDLSDDAAQPMRCPLTGNTLVFNGEIYNFVELRRELKALGHVFASQGDAEVLLHGWRAWGEGLFERCNGMWAVLLWERASGDLIFCRDRLGVKPLYLYQDGEHLLLASEPKALIAMLGHRPAPDPQALFDFLTVGVSDHEGSTFFDGVRAVAPGWVHRVSRAGVFRATPYHRWPEAGEAPMLEPAGVRALLDDATRLRLRADVPTMSLLSGGLDSAILTRLSLQAREGRSHYLGAFTYGYRDDALGCYDETAAAAELMAGWGAGAFHMVERADALPDAGELLELVAAQGEPFPTPSILASLRSYRALRAHGVKVVLSGEGADELFGGYASLYQAVAARQALREGRWLALLQRWRAGAFSSRELLNRLAWDLPLPWLGGLLRRRRPSAALIALPLWEAQRERLARLRDERQVDVGQRMRLDVLKSNLPMVLRMADRNSMRHGVEVRSPFLDYRLVSAALASPAEARMGHRHSKALLRSAFADQLPARLVHGTKDTGFGHAEQFLVSRMPWRECLEDLPADLGGWLDVPGLRRALAAGQAHSTLWLALSVALWFKVTYGKA